MTVIRHCIPPNLTESMTWWAGKNTIFTVSQKSNTVGFSLGNTFVVRKMRHKPHSIDAPLSLAVAGLRWLYQTQSRWRKRPRWESQQLGVRVGGSLPGAFMNVAWALCMQSTRSHACLRYNPQQPYKHQKGKRREKLFYETPAHSCRIVPRQNKNHCWGCGLQISKSTKRAA